MKKVIAFSIWGNKYRYLGGALQNIELSKHFYPDWICRFYIGKSTNQKFIDEISKNSNVEVIKMDEDGDWTGMFWRFLAAADPEVEVMMSRDADSRIHRREVLCVNEWLESNKNFHIIRDHPYHSVPIMGGMWGVRGNLIKNIDNMIKNYPAGNFWQTDQNFLTEKIYRLIAHDSLVHDDSRRFENYSKPIPHAPRNSDHFIGQAYDGDGKVLDSDALFTDYLMITENFEIKVYNEFNTK